MDESLISKRVVFLNQKDKKEFLEKSEFAISAKDLSKQFFVSQRTARDWLRGKYSIPQEVAVWLSDTHNISLPKYSVRSRTEHLKEIASKGGKERIKKYGKVSLDEDKRKKAWKRWWDREGKDSEHTLITKAHKISLPEEGEKLSEFVGIMMGDGGVSNYHISITLDAKTDVSYGSFVQKLIFDLFNVQAKEYFRKKERAINIVVHRKLLVEFCVSIGLKQGNKLKQGLDIPMWILNNKRYTVACIRGLFDTDGSIFMHTYISKGRQYSYPKMSFSSASPSLTRRVCDVLLDLGLNARITRNKREVRIEKKSDIKKYFTLIGSSNPKFHKLFGGVPERSNGTHC